MKGMWKICVCFIVCVVSPLTSSATGQEGDVIFIEGKSWSLLATPIEMDSVLSSKVQDNLPVNHSMRTSCWNGYTAFWALKENCLVLDSIQVICYDKEKEVEYAICFSDKQLHDIFGKYYIDKRIVASWVTDTLRAGNGNNLRYVHMGFNRTPEQEFLMNFHKGKLVSSAMYNNRLVKDGFCFTQLEKNSREKKDFNYRDFVREKFPLHPEKYPDLAGVKTIYLLANDLQMDDDGNLIDCKVQARYVDPASDNIETAPKDKVWHENQQLAEEFKLSLKAIKPWKTLYLRNQYVMQDPYILIIYQANTP